MNPSLSIQLRQKLHPSFEHFCQEGWNERSDIDRQLTIRIPGVPLTNETQHQTLDARKRGPKFPKRKDKYTSEYR